MVELTKVVVNALLLLLTAAPSIETTAPDLNPVPVIVNVEFVF